MDKKFGMALVALIGIGIFALPSTIALFSGQHSFYNIDATGNQVPCVKCHGDVKAELGSNNNGVGSPGPHKDFQCEYCHRAEVGFSSGDDAYAELHYFGTAGELVLATTIENFETSNFPKMIDYTSGQLLDATLNPVSNALDAQNKDGAQFNDQVVFREPCPTTDPGACSSASDPNKVYSGAIDTATATGLYNYSYSTEIATTGIAAQAFDAREVVVAGTVTDSSATGKREVTPGTRYHAASLVSCMECHGGEQSKGVAGYELNTSEPYNHANWVLENPTSCGNCHYGSPTTPNQGELWLSAGGFGLTNVKNDSGIVEAHDEFVKTTTVNGVLRSGAGQDGGYGAANIACVACHTHVAVDINFQKKYKVQFDAIAHDVAGGWDVNNFTAQGTVNISIYGNQSGGTWATSNKSLTWNPETDLYINGNGAKIVGLSNDTNDSAAALQ